MTVRIIRDQADFERFRDALRDVKISKPLKIETTLYDARTVDQNALMWPLLKDISDQVEWYGKKLKKETWKDMFMVALSEEDTIEVVPGINGGFVVVGRHTSKLSKAMFSDLIELIYAFGAEHDVKFR